MDNYLVLKYIHILCAIVLAGTGIGIAFFMLMAYLSKNISVIAHTARVVVWADWIFTTPCRDRPIYNGRIANEVLAIQF